MKIDRLLAEHQLLVTTAESCTGGLVASALVDIPGISDYFKEGYITYAPEAKEKILGVLPETISDYGVVSLLLFLILEISLEVKSIPSNCNFSAKSC